MQTSLFYRLGGPLVAALLFGFAGLAHAGSSYDDLDANGDGVISSEEAQADPTVAEKFGELDVDYDGQLNEAEFARFEEESESEEPATEEEFPAGTY